MTRALSDYVSKDSPLAVEGWMDWIEGIANAVKEMNMRVSQVHAPRARAEGLIPLELDGTDSITQGEEVLIIGYPLGSDTFTVHRGFLSARGIANEFPFGRLPQHEENCPLLQIDGTINEGFSGGPIVRISSNTIAGFVTSKYGLLQDFVQLRTEINQHLRSPLFQQIRERGARLEHRTSTLGDGSRIAFFKDPDGHDLEIDETPFNL